MNAQSVKIPNLLLLNQTRRIAQNIKLEGFQREYRLLIHPILSAYRQNKVNDEDMKSSIEQALVAIYRLTRTYQYIPNRASVGRTHHDYSQHSKLLELEKETEALLIQKGIMC